MDQQPPEHRPEGESGDRGKPIIDPLHRRRDMAWIARWPIPENIRQRAAAEVGKILVDKESSKRDVIAAAKALAALDRLNQEEERRAAGIPDQIIDVRTGVGVTINEPVKDLDYLDYLQKRAVAIDGGADSGDLGSAGEPGALEADAPPSGGEPPTGGNGQRRNR